MAWDVPTSSVVSKPIQISLKDLPKTSDRDRYIKHSHGLSTCRGYDRITTGHLQIQQGTSAQLGIKHSVRQGEACKDHDS